MEEQDLRFWYRGGGRVGDAADTVGVEGGAGVERTDVAALNKLSKVGILIRAAVGAAFAAHVDCEEDDRGGVTDLF